MWEALYENMEKFRFERHCGIIYYWAYNSIVIEVREGIFLPDDITLFVLEKYVKLNFFERRKLKKFVKQLNKLRKDKSMNQIKKLAEKDV